MWLSESQKIGIALTTFGVAFSIFGIMLFFDRGLLAIGNILYLAGIIAMIGPLKSWKFFAKKPTSSLFFFFGIGLVLMKHPIIGMSLQAFGFIQLFGDFLPVIVSFLKKIPIIGNLLSLPFLNKFIDRVLGPRLPI